MLQIVLSEQQYQNLGIFLSRSNLNASEVNAFLELNGALQQARPFVEEQEGEQTYAEQPSESDAPSPAPDAPASAPVPLRTPRRK